MDLVQQCISSAIKTYENDVCSGLVDDPDYNEIRIKFSELIIYMVRVQANIRYCSKDSCPCSPVSNLSHHFARDRELYKKLLSAPVYQIVEAIADSFLSAKEA